MHRALIALLSLLMLHGTAAAQGQRRLAFVVGIEDYRDLSPQGPAAVAECIGRAYDGRIAELDAAQAIPPTTVSPSPSFNCRYDIHEAYDARIAELGGRP